MGSDSTRYRTDCYHCYYKVCRYGCDDCSLCQNNMSEHRTLRRLESEFIEKVNKSCIKTLNICISAINDLKKDHNIFIDYTPLNNVLYFFNSTCLNCSKEILDKMEEMKNNILKNIDNFEINHNSYNFNRIEEEHKTKMKNIENEFKEKIDDIKRQKQSIELIYQNEIEEKKCMKDKLEKTKKRNNNDLYINNFIKQQNLKFDKKFNNEKTLIDSKYNFGYISEPIFEYTEEEKMERNMLYLNIRMIKKYSNIIPNYDITIKQFDLINDL